MQRLLDDDIGITVTQVQLQRVDPPTAVIDVQRARADQERARNEAEAYSRDMLPRARGDAQRIKQESEVYRAQVVNAAAGDSARFLSLYASYKDNEDITARRLCLETMDEVLRSANKVVIDGSGRSGSPLLPYLPLAEPPRPVAPRRAPLRRAGTTGWRPRARRSDRRPKRRRSHRRRLRRPSMGKPSGGSASTSRHGLRSRERDAPVRRSELGHTAVNVQCFDGECLCIQTEKKRGVHT